VYCLEWGFSFLDGKGLLFRGFALRITCTYSFVYKIKIIIIIIIKKGSRAEWEHSTLIKFFITFSSDTYFLSMLQKLRLKTHYTITSHTNTLCSQNIASEEISL